MTVDAAGGLAARVQRIVDGELPVLMLEPELPPGEWPLVVEGLVEEQLVLAPDEVADLPTVVRSIDLHCVWGWSRPDLEWEGPHLAALAARARPLPEAAYVVVGARDGHYAACFTIDEARDGLFARRMDGRPLEAEHGGPLRFVGPAYKWAYKHVKWVERVTFTDRFTPGMWEERVGDPRGDVPWDVLRRFDGQAQAWRARRRY